MWFSGAGFPWHVSVSVLINRPTSTLLERKFIGVWSWIKDFNCYSQLVMSQQRKGFLSFDPFLFFLVKLFHLHMCLHAWHVPPALNPLLHSNSVQELSKTTRGCLLGLREKTGEGAILLYNTLSSENENPLAGRWQQWWWRNASEGWVPVEVPWWEGSSPCSCCFTWKSAMGESWCSLLACTCTTETWKAISKKMPRNKLQPVTRLDKAPQFCLRRFRGK